MSTFDIETGRGGNVVVPDTPYPMARALWVGTSGDVEVKFPSGQTAIYTGVSGFLPVASIEIVAANTTASNITTIV